MSIIRFESVSKKFPDGTLGLNELSLQIQEGEFISLIGRSGAGKSTMLRLINRTNFLTSGQLTVLDHKLHTQESTHQVRHLRREIGFIFQQFNLIPTHTVLSNTLMGRLGYINSLKSIFGLFSKEDIELAESILIDVGLKDQIHKRVDQLSGGQQQRVAIARALVQKPKIILADEPLASLDQKLSETVLEILYQFNQKYKITVVVSVHVLELAKRRATRIIGLKKGKLVFDGTAQQLDHDKTAAVYEEHA